MDEHRSVDAFLNALVGKVDVPITVPQIADGIACCMANAHALYLDAVVLTEAGRPARALSLLISAAEEAGKLSILAGMSRIPTSNQAMWRDAWADFRNHRNKTTWAVIQAFPDQARSQPGLLMMAAAKQYDASPLVERLRQVGLYADYLGGQFGWFSPSSVSETDLADWVEVVEAVLARLSAFADIGLFSVQALQIQHDVYSPLNVQRKRRKDMTTQEWQQIHVACMPAHKQYLIRLVKAGIVPEDAEFEFLGVRFADFIAACENHSCE